MCSFRPKQTGWSGIVLKVGPLHAPFDHAPTPGTLRDHALRRCRPTKKDRTMGVPQSLEVSTEWKEDLAVLLPRQQFFKRPWPKTANTEPFQQDGLCCSSLGRVSTALALVTAHVTLSTMPTAMPGCVQIRGFVCRGRGGTHRSGDGKNGTDMNDLWRWCKPSSDKVSSRGGVAWSAVKHKSE